MLASIAVAATIAGCPLFPPSWSTNQRVDTLPVGVGPVPADEPRHALVIEAAIGVRRDHGGV